jgi:thioredoxin-like negative regulator of GroEL
MTLLLLLFSLVSALPRITNPTEADKYIHFISKSNLQDVLSSHSNDFYLVLFGTPWCPHTRHFTPQWLEVQEDMEAKGLDADVIMRKHDCSSDECKPLLVNV